MAHTCCEVKKEPHFLDERLLEWRVFEAVQPIFTSPHLKWRTQETRPEGAILDPNETARRIRLENAFDEFQIELQGLPDAAPEKDLACEVFDDCRDNLFNLLDFLESLTQESVISAACALSEPQDLEENTDPKDKQREVHHEPQRSETPYQPSFYVSSWFGSLARPFFKPTQLPTPEPEPVQSPISPSLASAESSPSSIRKPRHYFKLQALGKLTQKASEDEVDAVESCLDHLNLVQDGSEYVRGWEAARDFNICMTSPQVAGVSKLPEMSYPLEISKTRWKDTGPSEISRRLFRIICTKAAGSSCVHGLRQKHEAMLRLNGFQLEHNQPAFDMFFMPCKPPDVPEWQQVQFVPNTQQYGLRPQHVFALCSDIVDSRPQRQSDPSVLSFMFDEKKLSRMTADVLGHSGALPTMSLEELLRSDFVREPRAGGAFNPGDKAMLALSLSRCLLHLHQDPWMEKPWNAESVHFLHKQATHEVLDIHHPYIPYPFDKSKYMKKSVEPDIENYRRLLLSFARLLLEIDQGRPLDVDLDDPTKLDTARNTLSDLLESGNREGEPLVHYYQAIRGCLNFKASLTVLRRREPKAKPELQIRKVIYNNIIQHLEKNLSIIPRHAKFALTRRNLQMNKRSIESVPSNELHQELVQRRETMHLQKVPPKSPPLHSTKIRGKLASRGLDSKCKDSPRMIMFDGQTTYKNEHVTQAGVFIDDLQAFHRKYIHPKTQRRSNPRIRIAILDTGIDPDDSCIEGLIDDISEERWAVHKAEVKEQRANGNQVKMRRKSEFSPIMKAESFVDGETTDMCGHGTHMAGLILKVSPDADIFVAKISEDLEFEDTNPVVKAIEWAIAQEVDIISMSFGIPDRQPEIAAAIDKASKQIMFAAASNGGKNRPRTYPATDPRVICIHAMSGHGEGGPINPATEHEHDCLGTLGFGIKLRWKDEVVYKNGTSYATPIAAAIAANWLEWLNAVASDDSFNVTKVQHTNWRSGYGVKTIFSRAMSQRHQDLYCVAPWHLWKHDKVLSDSDILGTIRGKDGL